MLDSAGFDRLEDLALELGIRDARKIAESVLSGEFRFVDAISEGAGRRVAKRVKEALAETLMDIAAPVVISVILRLIMPERAGPFALLCRLCCGCAMMARFSGLFELARRTVSTSVRISETLSPVLAAALTIGGATASAALMSPASTLCALLIDRGLLLIGMPACAAVAVIAVGGNLSDGLRMQKLFGFLRRAVARGVALVIALFVGLLALEGRLAAAQDTLSARAVRQVIRGSIPIIGAGVSDSAGLLLSGAAAARNAIGVTGLLLAGGAGAAAIFRLSVTALSAKLAAAVIEPIADRGIVNIASGFGDAAEMLLAICAGGMLLVALLAGTGFGLFGGSPA